MAKSFYRYSLRQSCAKAEYSSENDDSDYIGKYATIIKIPMLEGKITATR